MAPLPPAELPEAELEQLQPFLADAQLDARLELGAVDSLSGSERDELAEWLAEHGDPADLMDGEHAPPPPLELEEPLEAAKWPPLAQDCSRRYTARRRSGTRRLSSIEVGVVHCTQGPTAAGAASWFEDDRSQGSAHVVADGPSCFRTLPPSLIPWGAPGVNSMGWHLELAGYAEWSRAEWLRHRGTLQRGAYKLAQNGRGRFPMRQLSDRELADVIRRSPHRRRGIVSHRQVSRVFGGTHHDPGVHFPWDVFMGYARRFERQLAGV